ncbi:MAG TPA: zinc ribbon domain-containing protein [Chthoniobacterales bacterium]|jgi:rRNA maturation protein Nop10|nr:zinc ribbon domain-containing protein [Chthoniobacterales bacterium]
MALVECKECGAQISENAETCPNCGDAIKEPKPKFSLLDLVHKISVPVVLSVAGTMITILSYFSMEGERQMEQTRKLLADAFEKDPIKQQYCIFYVDHLLESGRISPEMTVSVLATVAANGTSESVRLDALRTMPKLVEQKKYQEELRPRLARSISSLIPSLTEVEVLRRQAMLDIETLVEADESYRKPFIDELSALDRSWSFINNKPGGNSDQQQIRVGLQIRLALLSLVQDYHRAQGIGTGLVELAKPSPELSAFVRDQLDIVLASNPRTAVRVTVKSPMRALEGGNSFSPRAGEQRIDLPIVFIVAANDSQQAQGDKLAHVLKEKGINVQGVDLIGAAKDFNLKAPPNIEIRYSRSGNQPSFMATLAETVKTFVGEEPKLVGLAAGSDPLTYEIWFSER